MLCVSPLIMRGLPVGCSRCLMCKINDRRGKTGRLLIESLFHEKACMLTLTYDQAHVPVLPFPNSDGEFLQTLRKSDVQDFFKRLRWRMSTDPNYMNTVIRKTCAGEYGDKKGRPHYHVALFGLDSSDSEIIEQSWTVNDIPIGTVDIQELNETTMHYICGYVVKKMTKSDDARLQGREPEFYLSHARPAIGHGLVERMLELRPDWLFDEYGDVLSEIVIGGRKYPLGRTLQSKLRVALGVGDGSGKAPQGKIQKLHDEMSAMSSDTSLDASDWLVIDTSRSRKSREDQVLHRKLLKASRQKARNAEARYKLRLQKNKPVERDLCDEKI